MTENRIISTRMVSEKIVIANLKCSGCAKTIKNSLSALKGVSHISVIPEKDAVFIDYEESIKRSDLIKKLRALGYPEATEENGLLLKIKSYASCMTGRMDN